LANEKIRILKEKRIKKDPTNTLSPCLTSYAWKYNDATFIRRKKLLPQI